ncbi:MAG: helix-hairpin-helix domain-containing protein [Bacteroidetes bacterium]|nr:helix-hairpin-helix domain-containing protein [Bacteroidota bacterium]
MPRGFAKKNIHCYRVRPLYLLTSLPLYLFTSFLFSPHSLFSQEEKENEKENIVEQKIENIAETNEEEESDYTSLLDELNHYLDNPLNLNNASREELESLQLLSDVQVNNLLMHIKQNGKLIVPHELQTIDGFDPESINRIMPFVIISPEDIIPRTSLRSMIEDSRNELFIRYQSLVEDQKGFLPADSATMAAKPNDYFLGSKPRIYARYRFKYANRISIGITGEKDSGEEFFKGTQKNGFDFYSAHFYLKDFGFLKALAIGDYHAQFGQGLAFWSGYGYNKSSDVSAVKKKGGGLKPYTSVDENLFLRGGGITAGLKGFDLTAFYSSKKIDGNISVYDTLTEDVQLVTSFQTTGYHTIPSELADKDAVGEMIYGGNFSFNSRRFHAGITAVRSEYDAMLSRDLTFYNRFEFIGNKNSVLGFDYGTTVRNMNLFGEISRSMNGGIAFLNGLIISIDPRVSFSAVYRNYKKEFQPIYSAAFGESTKNINEEGIYMGVQMKLPNRFTLSAYYDYFKFPWMKYLVDAPSTGSDYLVQLNYTPFKKLDMYMRVRQRDKFKNQYTTDDADIDYIAPYSQVNYRYNISYQVTPAVKLRSRVEYLTYTLNSGVPADGYLIYQDFIYKIHGSPFSVVTRYAFFDTDNYDTRIYMYESDVVGAYSVPAVYYKGGRGYFMLRYRIFHRVDLWLRYARTFYTNKDVIGTDIYEIQANHKSEVKVQVKIGF